MEVTFVRMDGDGLFAQGFVIASASGPYQLGYRLQTREEFLTKRVALGVRGPHGTRELHLLRDRKGRWTELRSEDGGDEPDAPVPRHDLEGCEDCDIGFSPLTNTPPILRHRLQRAAGAADVTAAWISIPDLAVTRLEQRYTRVGEWDGGAVVRYETRDGSFTADLEVDADGFVVRYPGLADRIS